MWSPWRVVFPMALVVAGACESGWAADAGPGTHRPPAVAAPKGLAELIRLQLAPVFRGCYERHLKKNPALSVRGPIGFALSPEGRVVDVTVPGVGAETPLGRCLIRRLDALRLPPRPHRLEISYPLNTDPAR
jgi:hypothetical protein